MQFILRECKELYLAMLALLAFYLRPTWLIKQVKSKHALDNAIEYAMQHVKKSVALMVIIITLLSLIFTGLEFVQEHEKPAEIFAVLLVHGALVSAALAALAWLFLRDHQHVGLLVGWFILVYWLPMWLWNMGFEIQVGFAKETDTHLFLQLIHQQALHGWHASLLGLIWLHATAMAVFGLHQLSDIRSRYLWLLGLGSSGLYLASFLLVHHTRRGVELVYEIFGMG